MKAVIMAGGEGVRLRPFTYLIPKPLLPVGDLTVLEHTIRDLAGGGIGEFFISTNYHAKQFQKCVPYGEKYGVRLHLFKEYRKLGTAGALYLIKDSLNDPFCVVNGDLIFRVDIAGMFRFHREKSADITIGIKQYRLTVPYAIIERAPDGALLDIKEKPTYTYHINAGIYVLSPSVLAALSAEVYLEMPILIDSIRVAGGKVFVYDIGDQWLDIGQISDYERAIDLIEQWKVSSQ